MGKICPILGKKGKYQKRNLLRDRTTRYFWRMASWEFWSFGDARTWFFLY